MPQSIPRFMARTSPPAPNADWCRIVNKKKGNEKIAEVHIYDEIGFWGTSASEFVKQLNELDDDIDAVDVHINSPGGDVFDGVAIHSALKQLGKKKPVRVIVDALAASAASFIAQAGTEITMMRNATMMIHDASGMVWGTAESMRKQADVLDRVSDNIADIYSQGNSTSAVNWRAVMKEEAWYNGTEAVEAGLAHRVDDEKDEDAEKATANWDLSVFNHAGRDKAPSPSRVMQQVKFLNTKEKNVAKKISAHEVDSEVAGATGDGEPIPEGDGIVPVADPGNGDNEAVDSDDENGKSDEGAVAPASNSMTTFVLDGVKHTIPSTSTTASSGMTTVVVNGVSHTVPADVAKRMTVLEASVSESVVAGKKSFIESLSNVGKISAAQIPSLELYALGLDDSGYDSWKATWDLAPATVAVSYKHGASNTSQSAGAVDESSSELEITRQIVESLRRSGLAESQIAKTPSAIKLAALLSANQA